MQYLINTTASGYHTRSFTVVMLVMISHAGLILLPPVNFERAFANAALFFQVQNPLLIQEYFAVQANTVGIPFFAAQLSQLLPGVPMLQVMRILVLLGIPLLADAVQRVCLALGRDDAHRVTAYVLLNPLIWIYAGRATADFLPMSLGIWAISLVIQPSISNFRAIMAGMMLGLAAVLKYHTAFLVVAVAAYHLRNNVRDWPIKSAAIFLTGMSVPLLFYLVKTHAAFGFWLTPPEFQSKHQFSLAGFFSNLICYAGYLTLLVAPTLIFIPEFFSRLRVCWKSVLLTVVTMGLIGFFTITDNGEMNLGPADRWIPSNLRISFFSVLAAGGGIALWMTTNKVSRASSAIKLAIITILVIFSLTRPAQRYLLFVLPLAIALLPSSIFSSRIIFPATLIFFVVVNTFVEYSRACTGIAAERMVRKIIEVGLAPSTDLGHINGHVGLYINNTPPTRVDFTVVKGSASNAIVVTQAGIGILATSFSLIPASKAPSRIH